MYSKRVKFTAVVAGLCLAEAAQSGVFIGIKWLEYTSDVSFWKKYGGTGRYSLLDFLKHAQDRILLSVVFVGVAAVIGAIAMHYARIERRIEQEQRDRIAERLAAKIERQVASLKAGSEIQPFALYLRPFALEKTIREWKIGTGSFKTFFLETGKVNFEHFLLEIFNSLDIVLIGIGFPDGQEGAGHVTTTDIEWSDRFRKLADRAAAIVVVPGTQPGIIEEIQWLKESGLLMKTIFFKPKWYPRIAWQKMRQFHEYKRDIELPAFSSKQVTFRVDSSGRCCDVTLWRTGLWRRVTERQMRSLLVHARADSN